MKRLLIAVAILLGVMTAELCPAQAQGCGPQNPNCVVPTAPLGTNNNQAASTAFVLANGGGVASVANSDGTLTISPTTGPVVGSLNLSHANTWLALQTFSGGVLGGGTTTNYFVATTGNDSNTCLSGGSPCLTLQGAWNKAKLANIGAGTLVVNIADGTYTNGLLINGAWNGAGPIAILGNCTTPANVIINPTNNNAIAVSNATVIVGCMELRTTTSGDELLAAQGGQITLSNSNMRFGTTIDSQLSTEDGGRIIVVGDYSIVGGAGVHMHAINNSYISVTSATVTLTGTPAFSAGFAGVGELSEIVVAGVTYSGSATGSRFTTRNGGTINTAGAGFTFFPGNAAGICKSGGIYDTYMCTTSVFGAVTTQPGTTYTFTNDDCGTEVVFTSGSAVTGTIPATLNPGCNILVLQAGAGAVSVNGSAVTPATLNSTNGFATLGQWSSLSINIEANSGGSSAIAVLKGASGTIISNGSGAIGQGTSSGTATVFGTVSGALTSGNCVQSDASHNLVDAGAPCGGAGGGITALTGDVTASGSGSVAATLATAQPAVHTWALAQTFTVAPVFTNQPTSRTALGLGTMATQAASAVAITGGTIAGLTGLGIRDTSAAFDVTVAAVSSVALTAGRTLTLDVVNAARTLKLGANLTLATDPGAVTGALKSNGSGTFTQAACADLVVACLTANQTVTLSGDATGSGATAITTTLATVNANVGSFGSATQVGTFTVNGKGLITAAGNTTVTPAVGSITGLGTGVATALAANLNGSGAISATTSPVFVSPTLGAAAGTSLALGGGSIGTDALEVTGTTTHNGALTTTGQSTFNIATTVASASGAALNDVIVSAATTTITGTTTTTELDKVRIGRPTLTDGSAVTVTTGATFRIDNSPLAAGSVTITNPLAFYIAGGASLVAGPVILGTGATPALTNTFTAGFTNTLIPLVAHSYANGNFYVGANFNLSTGIAFGSINDANNVLEGMEFRASQVLIGASALMIGTTTDPGYPNVLGAGSILSNGATAGIGYATGAGGTVTQATSKATGVTLNKASGAITMNAAALAAGTIVSFVLTDSAIAATDVLVLNHISGGTIGSYTLNAQAAAGTATINVRNNTGGSLSDAIVIQFAVIKGVNS